MGNFLEELKRRQVYRISAIYAVVAWSLIQIADVVLPTFSAPLWLNQLIILTSLAGFPLILILAWSFELTPGGLKKTESLDQAETISLRKRDYLLGAVVSILVVTVIWQQVYLLTRLQSPRAVSSGEYRNSDSERIGEILRLAEGQNNVEALALARELESARPENPLLAELLPQFTTAGSVLSIPEGAGFAIREYSDPNAEWIEIGVTPVENVLLPNGYFRTRMTKEGFQEREGVAKNPFPLFGNSPGNPGSPFPLPLSPDGAPSDMVQIPPMPFAPAIAGLGVDSNLFFGPYLVDKYEVSNQEFKEFVDQGGYDNPQLWENLEFIDSGKELNFEQAVSRFVDTTGRPGSANWELGSYPSGTESLPVTGVSWYEAVAYARFRGKELPTVYHWARAAYMIGAMYSAPLISVSNFSGSPVPVTDDMSVGPFGTYNMAGNAREWVLNPQDSNRWVLGGSWNDDVYMAMLAYNLPPFTRDAVTGFRLVQYLDDTSTRDELELQPRVKTTDYRDETPASDEVYSVIAEQYVYSSSNLSPETDYSDNSHPDWTEEKVLLNTGYSEEKFGVYLFSPKSPGPHDAVIGVMGTNAFSANGRNIDVNPTTMGLDFLVSSGRSIVVPVFYGAYERYDGFNELSDSERSNFYRERLFRWRSDLGRTLDYLATRSDISGSIGYLGVSFGASVTVPLVALEPRLKVVILDRGGFSWRQFPAAADPLHFVSRITQPVLMLSGRFDSLFPIETRQEPFFDMLGSDPKAKRRVIFDIGHIDIPRPDRVREIVDWLDKYL